MGMKSNALAMFALAMAMSSESNRREVREFTPKTKPQRLPPLNKNLKEFDYNGNKVIALNKKNADRKAKRLGYLV